MTKLGKPNMQAQQRFVRVLDMPTDILIELTSHCNLNCIMCPQSKLTRPKGVMPFDLWTKIIDELAEKSPQTRIWPALMGESLLLGMKFFDYIRYAKDAGMERITLNTNLNIFKDEWLDALFESRLDEMVISMDGITPATYEKIRVNGHLHTVLNNVRKVAEAKTRRASHLPKLLLQYVVMDENEHEQEDFINYWRQSGFEIDLKIKPRTGWASDIPAWTGVENVADNEQRIPCTWLLRQMTILWNGIVPQCDGDWNLDHPDCGDLNKQTVAEIWKGDLKKIRDRHLSGDWNFMPCQSCKDWAAGTSNFFSFGPASSQPQCAGCQADKGQQLAELAVSADLGS